MVGFRLDSEGSVATAEREVVTGAAGEARLVDDVSGLVSPPAVALKVFELVRCAQASAEEIGDVVATDPNLSARLLRIVNSAFYGFPARVDTIPRAVQILGTGDLSNLVLAISAVRAFSSMGAGIVRLEEYWRHSVLCGLLARHLARRTGVRDPDRLFVCGLLHDVGICVIYTQLRELTAPMREVVAAGEALLHAAEIERLGFSHASVGARLLESWELPEALLDAVRHHHDPGVARVARAEAAVVHVADALANSSQLGPLNAPTEAAPAVDEGAWEILGGPDALGLDEVLAAAREELDETMRSLMPTGQ